MYLVVQQTPTNRPFGHSLISYQLSAKENVKAGTQTKPPFSKHTALGGVVWGLEGRS